MIYVYDNLSSLAQKCIIDEVNMRFCFSSDSLISVDFFSDYLLKISTLHRFVHQLSAIPIIQNQLITKIYFLIYRITPYFSKFTQHQENVTNICIYLFI